MNATTIKPFEDASGAPAVITVDGWTFAFDYLGEIKMNILTNGSRRPSKRTIRIATWIYQKELAAAVTCAWIARNHTMYLTIGA